MKRTASDKGTHGISITGSGRLPVLLVNGFGYEQSLWQPLCEQLGGDYRLIRFDHAGTGRAIREATELANYTTLDAYADDLLVLVESLGDEPLVVVGHSIGGIIAMLAARRCPERFRQLIMINASSRYLNDAPDYHGGFEPEDIHALLDMMEQNHFDWAGRMAADVIGVSAPAPAEAQLREQFLATEAVVARRFAEVLFFSDTRSRLAEVTVPVVVAQTDGDAVVSREGAEYLAAQLPNARLAWLPVEGHYPQIRAPEMLADALRAWITA
ncbi:alpha/beta fold hydrolase [Modicisalibacter tunisiensis]|uniref:Alpha/beta hydrolase n=1 Tax=Modicisalibacter tunisiensis TaxID=390637 RepID=A0ABS7WX97_9GAMM|nr:alpha/beta hydrolase [Modicisalibacter tunisiensis]MBZ9566754.1 alpha/beta hydrolase [Modicisalibacter tunisiensis]